MYWKQAVVFPLPENILETLSPSHKSADAAAENVALTAASLQAAWYVDDDTLFRAFSFRDLVQFRIFLARFARVRTDDVVRTLLENGDTAEGARNVHCPFLGRRVRVYFLCVRFE